MFERIVVGLDGSAASEHAMEWAGTLAGDARLVLVHVARSRESTSDYPRSIFDRGGARVRLIDEAEQLRLEHPGIRVVSTMGSGSAVDVLRSFLRPGTLLVVGRDPDRAGRRSAGVRLAGSHGGGAVALVPDRAVTSGSRGIVAGIDGSALGQEVVRVPVDLAEAAGQPMTLLHVRSAPGVWQRDLAGFAGEFEDEEQRYRDTLSDAAATAVDYGGRPDEVLVQGEPVDELLAASKHAVALVVGSHGGSPVSRFMLGSVSHELLMRSPVAVVVVRPA